MFYFDHIFKKIRKLRDKSLHYGTRRIQWPNFYHYTWNFNIVESDYFNLKTELYGENKDKTLYVWFWYRFWTSEFCLKICSLNTNTNV